MSTPAARELALSVEAGSGLVDRAKVTLLATSGTLVRRSSFEVSVVPEDRLDVTFGDAGVIVSVSVALEDPGRHRRIVVFRDDGGGYVRDRDTIRAFSADGKSVESFGDAGAITLPPSPHVPALSLDETRRPAVAFREAETARASQLAPSGAVVTEFAVPSWSGDTVLASATKGAMFLVGRERTIDNRYRLRAERLLRDAAADPAFVSRELLDFSRSFRSTCSRFPEAGTSLEARSSSDRPARRRRAQLPQLAGSRHRGRRLRSVLRRRGDGDGGASTRSGTAILTAQVVDDGNEEPCSVTASPRGIVTRIRTSDGVLDPTFVDGGVAELPLASVVLNDVATEPDGRALVVEATGLPGSMKPILLRFLADGRLDPALKGNTPARRRIDPRTRGGLWRRARRSAHPRRRADRHARPPLPRALQSLDAVPL